MNSVLAIYPTADKVEDLLKHYTRTHSVLIGHRLTTFPQLVDALCREANPKYLTIGPIGERLALEQAINQVTARGLQLPFPASVGVREHLLRIIHEFKSAAVEATDLRAACAQLLDEDSSRVGAIAEIFAEYEAVLQAAGAVDAHGQERLVLQWLHRAEQTGQRPHFLDGIERLLVAEVYDPSLVQFMLVSSLIRLIGDATLTIQAEPFDLEVRRFAELTWNRFVAEASIADKVLPNFVRRNGRRGRLGFVLTHLFAGSADQATPEQGGSESMEPGKGKGEGGVTSANVPPPDGTVRILAAPDRRREAEEVARAIRRMLELPPAERIPLERIAIVARTLAPYRDYLEAAFRAYRIPLCFHERRPLLSYAAVRVVKDVLRIPLEDYHRDRLLSLCRAPFLRFAASGYDELPGLVGYIDRRTRPLGSCIKQRRAELRRALTENPHNARAVELRRQLAALERAAGPWSQFLDLLVTLEHPATIAGHVARTADVLARLGFDPLRESVTDSAAAAAGPVRSALEALAREGEIICPQRELSLEQFVALVEQTFERTTAEAASNHLHGVRAITVTDARGLDFEQVFIIGLNDGLFPIHHLQNSLISDHAIGRLNASLRAAIRQRLGCFAPDQPGPILRTHADRNLEEPFLFFLAMSMATESVVLTYSKADISGNPLVVSPFVEEVSRILDTSAEQISGDGLIPRASDCFGRQEFLARAALDSMLPEQGMSTLAGVVEVDSIVRRTEAERRREQYFALPTREELVKQRRRQAKGTSGAEWLAIDLSSDTEKFSRATKYDGRVQASSVLRHSLLRLPNGQPRSWSAAQLTDLATCGFKFLAGQVLRLRETAEGDYQRTAAETGTLVHEIVREIFTRAQDSDPASLRVCAREVLEEFHERESHAAPDPAFFQNDWLIIEAMVEELIEHEAVRLETGQAASELFHELEFNFKLPIRPGLAGAAAEIVLAGRIDRLEIYREQGGQISSLRLIDYKTSRRLKQYEERLKPAYFAAEDLQMPVYALAAAEHFRSELSPRASIKLSYIVLKNRAKQAEQEIPLDLLGSQVESSRRKTVRDRLADLVNEALAGHFDVDPLQCSDYCPYRRVCRYRKIEGDW